MKTIESLAIEIRDINERLFKARQVTHRLEEILAKKQRQYDSLQRESFSIKKAESILADLSMDEQLILFRSLKALRS